MRSHAYDPHVAHPGSKSIGVRAGYDLWAEGYDATPNPAVALDERITLDLLAPRAGERILDAGCGTGRNLARLIAAGAIATGIDFSRGMLDVARKRCPGAALRECDLHAELPFASHSFDAVLCALIGEHLRALEPAFPEFRRVLRAGGRLVFSVWHPRMVEVGKVANFTQNDIEYRLGAERHSVADYEAALCHAGFTHIERHEGEGSGRYAGMPLLLVLCAR